MRILGTTISVLALSATVAGAGGLDRNGQPIGLIFEEGDYAELSFGYISPSASGNDAAVFGGGATGDVLGSYTALGFGYKQQINDKLSFSLIVDQPFVANTQYTPGLSVALGGTFGQISSTAYTGIARYEFNDNLSIHGGLRAQTVSGRVGTLGAAFGGLNGYNATFESDTAYGYVVGAAYELPDIALRVALTYQSAIEHSMATSAGGNVGGGVPAVPVFPFSQQGPTTIRTPESVNLDFQSGIAEGTLLFGSVRYVPWSKLVIKPDNFPAASMASLKDTYTFTLGVGRRLNETWSVSALLDYERPLDPIVSPLGPTIGRTGFGVGAVYTSGNMKITGGVRYTLLGDSTPGTGTPPAVRANFTGSSAVSAGVKVGFSF